MGNAALQDTLDIMRTAGRRPDEIGVFQRAVERYRQTTFDFDFTRFPESLGGFYSFKSASALIAALPHPLCETRHGYDFNCFDTVITLAGNGLRTKIRPDDLAEPFLVPYTATNGDFSIISKATAREAFTLLYPSWYREATRELLPEDRYEDRLVLTAALFRCHRLPETVTEVELAAAIMDTLQSEWRQQDLNFPTDVQVVLCHEVCFMQKWFVTVHAGLLFSHQRGYTYIEKSGGSGPFVRLDFHDRSDLLIWLAAMFRGAEKLGYTHHFAAFDGDRIESLVSCIQDFQDDDDFVRDIGID